MNEQERRDGLADQIDDHIREYRDFAFKDDMLKMAIAFILGGAFSKTVNAISESLIMPLLNFILQLTGENWRTATWEPIEGLVFEVGKFAAASVDFLLISLVLFAMWKAASRLRATSASHTSS